MDHADLYLLRETYNAKKILLCFNGPFSQGLIEEIGVALREYLQGEETADTSSAMDVFAIYIEIAQNVRHYAAQQEYSETEASATVVIGRDEEGRYVVTSGNVVEPQDGKKLEEKIRELAEMDKAQLKAAYKTQLRRPRDENAESAGLGLIDIARKAGAPISCSLQPVNSGTQLFFSLRVVI